MKHGDLGPEDRKVLSQGVVSLQKLLEIGIVRLLDRAPVQELLRVEVQELASAPLNLAVVFPSGRYLLVGHDIAVFLSVVLLFRIPTPRLHLFDG